MTIASAIFRQYDIRGVVDRDLTPAAVRAVGAAFAALMTERAVRGAVAIGRDNRPSGERLRDALVDGLTGRGVDVVDIGMVPTPVLYWSLHHTGVVGGIQVTGSHNPPEYNGLKLSLGTASLHGTDIQRIYELTAEAGRTQSRPGRVRQESVLGAYVDDMARRIGRLARPIRAVFDCGNGAASLVAPDLFQRLGLEARGLFCESDGTFPNHHPDPTVPANLEDLIRAVRAQKAEIGVAFDGDGDRIGVVDDTGDIVWGDRLLILYARDVLRRVGAGAPIIFDVKCSQALPAAIEAAGGTPIMWKTGHSLIKEKMKESAAPLAGEMSGHMFFAEGFYGHDDAVYAAGRLLRIVADSGRTVRELLSDVPPFVATPEIRIDCPDDVKFSVVERAVRYFGSRYEVVDVDGARVLFGDGWGLIRASNTQPVIVARYEARTAPRMAAIRDEMEGWLRSQGVRV
ncbi:MAG: phosphomannomutase/phosphoglucomutase [Gemmatimonadaceae bacterium]